MKEIHIQQKRATTRMGHLPVEGGGLNAGYDTVDAVANICTTAVSYTHLTLPTKVSV